MILNGMKYQAPFAVIIGHEEELCFGSVLNIYVHGKSLYFEFIPMITEAFHYHFHAYALAMPSNRSTYLIKPSCLLDFHPYGLYRSTVVCSNHGLQYVVTRSNIHS